MTERLKKGSMLSHVLASPRVYRNRLHASLHEAHLAASPPKTWIAR